MIETAHEPDKTHTGHPAGPPTPFGPRLARPGLRARIEEADAPLLLVVAPAGYGKTSLLGEWARATKVEVAWLACRPSDSERTRFWPKLVTSLAARWPDMGTDSTMILSRPTWDDDALVASLARDLAEVPGRPAALVIDDCQYADQAQRALFTLAQEVPRHVRLILAGQRRPPFSTSRFLVTGLLAELNSADLAFTLEEVSELLRLSKLDLCAGDLRQLHALTSGWPAGLKLAVLAMSEADEPGDVVHRFATTNRAVSDYLVNEVFNQLPAALTEFVTTIGVLDEFDSELCETVTGRDDAGELLRQVVDRDLFISSVDPGATTFRFHAVFGAYLQARLKSLGPDAYRAPHVKAIALFRERGDTWGALHHAMAIDDVQLAGSLLTHSLEHALEVADAREARAVAQAWLRRLGEAALTSDVGQLLQVLLVLTSWGAREAQTWLSAIEDTHPDLDPAVAAITHGAWGDYHLGRGEVTRALERNRQAQACVDIAIGRGPVFARLAELPLQAAGAHLLAGDVLAAGVALDGTSPVVYPLIDEFRLPVLKSWVAFLEGDLISALGPLSRLIQKGEECDAVDQGLGRIFETLIRGACHLERLEADPAAAAMANVAAATERNARPVIQSLVYVWLARLATAQRNHAAALTALAQSRMVLAAPDDRALDHLAVEEFRVAVALEPSSAHRLTHRLPTSNPSRLLQARLLVSRGARPNAEQMLASIEPATLRETIEWGVLSSLAAQHRDLASAHEFLRASLTLAEPHRFVATIIEQGGDIASLLQTVPVSSSLRPYVDTLVVAAQKSGHRRQPPSAEDPGALTARELTVLGLLASRLTTAEIAETLFISLNTLKSHLKSVYRKLDVSSRDDAVREGESRGLL